MKKISIAGVIPKKYRAVGNYFYSPKAHDEDINWCFYVKERTETGFTLDEVTTNGNHQLGELPLEDMDDHWTWGIDIEFYQITPEEYALTVISGGTIWPT